LKINISGIGIRLALGAKPGEARVMVLRQGLVVHESKRSVLT